MTIIQVIPQLTLGGAETMCANLSVELAKNGHDVTIACFYQCHPSLQQRLEENGVEILFLEKQPGFDRSVVKKLRKLFSEKKPQAVHGHLHVNKYIVPAARGLKIPRIVHTVHNVAQKESNLVGRISNYFAYKWHKVISVGLSELVADTIKKTYHLKKVPVIFNGVPLEHCVPKQDYALGEEISLCHVARFSYQKNHKGLIESMAIVKEAFPNAVLHLFGEGGLQEEMQQLIESLSLQDNVKIEGPTDRVFWHMSQSDLFVLPSHYEGMPMTLIEAMGTSLPIVASPVGGVPDMLQDEESCLFCATDAQSIADAVIRMLSDPALREKCGIHAGKESERFSAQTMCREYLKLYEEIRA